MVATDFFLNAMKRYKAKQLQKEAVTYEDMRDFVERMKRSGRVINKDFVDVSREHPGDIGRVTRFRTNGDIYQRMGPSALPKRQAKEFGFDPNYALNPANRAEIKAWERERIKLENDVLRRQFEAQKNLVNRQQRLLEEEKAQLQQPKPQPKKPSIRRNSNIENKRKFGIAKVEPPKKASLLDRVKKLNLLDKVKGLFRR